MLKIEVSYLDEDEFRRWLQLNRPYIKSIKPKLREPPRKSTQSRYLKRDIRIVMDVTKPDSADEQAIIPCSTH